MTKPWTGYDTIPAKSAVDVDASATRTGRVALLAAKFSQPAGVASSSKWPCKFPEVDDLEQTLPSHGGRGGCSPMNGDENSFVPVNGMVFQSQTLHSAPVPLSPETLNRRILSPRVTRSSRSARSLNPSFDYEQVGVTLLVFLVAVAEVCFCLANTRVERPLFNSCRVDGFQISRAQLIWRCCTAATQLTLWSLKDFSNLTLSAGGTTVLSGRLHEQTCPHTYMHAKRQTDRERDG